MREINPEIASEMAWSEFVSACFYKLRQIYHASCHVCGHSCEFPFAETDRIAAFIEQGWRYERRFEGIVVKCPDCTRKRKVK